MTHRGRPDGLTVRAAAPDDRSPVTRLVGATASESRYAEVPSYFVNRAFDVGDNESRILLAESSGVLRGCALFGDVAGTIGTGRVHFIGVDSQYRRAGVGTTLCEAAVDELTARGARAVMIEMPDDATLAPGRALLETCRFELVARVGDYYRDGVDLIVLERRRT